MAIFCYILLLG